MYYIYNKIYTVIFRGREIIERKYWENNKARKSWEAALAQIEPGARRLRAGAGAVLGDELVAEALGSRGAGRTLPPWISLQSRGSFRKGKWYQEWRWDLPASLRMWGERWAKATAHPLSPRTLCARQGAPSCLWGSCTSSSVRESSGPDRKSVV